MAAAGSCEIESAKMLWNATFPRRTSPAVRRFKALHKGSSNMQFRKDRGQDEKDMAFETFRAKTLNFFRSTSVKHSRLAETTIFLQHSYTTHTALESSRLAELKHAIWAAWDVRKKITAFDRAIWTKFFLARDGRSFFISLFPYLSIALYLQYASPSCVKYTTAVRISKAKVWVPRPPWSMEHLNMHERRLSLLDTNRSQKINDPRKICPNGEAGRPAHRQADYWFFFA